MLLLFRGRSGFENVGETGENRFGAEGERISGLLERVLDRQQAGMAKARQPGNAGAEKLDGALAIRC